ncbi:MAG: PQQ-binding-like beta-propeller repeat protein [Planctomycetaceae bacterium]|nr:PQQ-binding-like beta-propeller repeat protein [Planctomycetaceae bacterium]
MTMRPIGHAGEPGCHCWLVQQCRQVTMFVSRIRCGITPQMHVLCIVIALAFVLSRAAIAQDGSPPLRESVTLDVPLLVAKQFANIRGLIEQEQWSDAIAALDHVTDEHAASLVEASPGRYLNAVDYARLLITQLPPDGLATYREQIDGWAEQQIEEAKSLHDDASLQVLLRDAFASSWGDDALWLLGERQWETGDISAARQTWTRLLPLDDETTRLDVLSYPNPEIPLADVAARLVMCSIAEREMTRAASELQEFTQEFPMAEGTIAGREGRLSEILSEVFEESKQWSPADSTREWPTFARDTSRNACASTEQVLDGPHWMIPLAPISVAQWERERADLGRPAPLSRFPVVSVGTVFFHDGRSIRAVNLMDGKPCWPTDDEADVGDIYPPFKPVLQPLLRPAVGVPRFTSTVVAGRLYALTGPSVLTLPESRLQPSPSRLVCLDIADGEGLLQWFKTDEDLFVDGWRMTGTPAADGERLYLPLMRTAPQPEQGIVCLSADDGSFIWQTRICQALTEPLSGRIQLGHQLLTLSDDRLLCSTDMGAIASLVPETGVIRWVVTYPSTALSPTERSEENLNGLLPPLVSEGVAFVKPNDSDELMAIDVSTGATLWSRSLPSHVVHLLGATGRDLYVSGDQLWCMETATGQMVWQFGHDDPAGFGYGRGVVAGDHIFWTTHDSLFTIDRHAGRAVQRYPLAQVLGVAGGNMVLANDRLLIAGTDHLTAFGLTSTATATTQAGSDSPK